MFIRSAFNYDTDAASNESALLCSDLSLTKQSFKEECDINVLVERFLVHGADPRDIRVPQYADFSEVTDYHTACNVIAKANESFDALDAKVRERFHNDPQEFLDFCAVEDNLPEMRKMGLAVEAAAPEGNTPEPDAQLPT